MLSSLASLSAKLNSEDNNDKDTRTELNQRMQAIKTLENKVS
jgi:hypothetical protein